MANYHASIKVFSRSKGHSAVNAICYRAGVRIKDERIGETFDYTKRKGVAHTEILTPKNSPDWSKDVAQLWNKVEEAELRKNSAVAREFEVSLPHELNEKQRLDLSRNITQNLVDRFGFATQFSIHHPDDENSKNFHVHILASTRKLEPTGFTEKTRELDEMKKTKEQEANPAILEVRKMIEITINDHLEKAGKQSRVDCRTLEAQQMEAIKNKDIAKAIELSREPQHHVGKNPTQANMAIQHNQAIKQQHQNQIHSLIEKISQEVKPQKIGDKKMAIKIQMYWLSDKLQKEIEKVRKKDMELYDISAKDWFQAKGIVLPNKFKTKAELEMEKEYAGWSWEDQLDNDRKKTGEAGISAEEFYKSRGLDVPDIFKPTSPGKRHEPEAKKSFFDGVIETIKEKFGLMEKSGNSGYGLTEKEQNFLKEIMAKSLTSSSSSEFNKQDNQSKNSTTQNKEEFSNMVSPVESLFAQETSEQSRVIPSPKKQLT